MGVQRKTRLGGETGIYFQPDPPRRARHALLCINRAFRERETADLFFVITSRRSGRAAAEKRTYFTDVSC